MKITHRKFLFKKEMGMLEAKIKRQLLQSIVDVYVESEDEYEKITDWLNENIENYVVVSDIVLLDFGLFEPQFVTIYFEDENELIQFKLSL